MSTTKPYHLMMLRIESPLFVPLTVLCVCIAALGSAYTAQYLFGLEPCILCLYQRIPYALAGLLAIGAVTFAGRPRIAMLLIAATIPVFLGEAALAFYHTGVEQHWWQGSSACTGQIPSGLSVDDMLARIDQTPPARCDQVSWSIFGLSVTVYNVVLALALAVFAAIGARRLKRTL